MFGNKLIKTHLWKTRPNKEGSTAIEDDIYKFDPVTFGVYIRIAMNDPKGIIFEDLVKMCFKIKAMPNQSKDMNRFKKRFTKILKELLDNKLIVL